MQMKNSILIQKIMKKIMLLFFILLLAITHKTSSGMTNDTKGSHEENNSEKSNATKNQHSLPSTEKKTEADYSDIKNATMLSMSYEKCMKNYDKRFRPYFGEKSVNVDLEIHVMSFDRIDESAMEFGIDFYFAQFWIDPRLIDHDVKYHYQHSAINLIGNEVEKVWVPDTVFVNSKFSRYHDVTVNNRFLSINFTTGKLIYHARISTTAQCRMDLRDYPFDTQTCYLAVESYGHHNEQLTYGWHDYSGNNCTKPQCINVVVYDKEMSNFDVVEAVKSKNKTTYHSQRFSSATAKFTFQRRTKYFLLQIYLPCICIVMVTWMSFWITPTAVPARTAICVTTILTLITMLGIVNANMPKVSYIKALDLYLFVAFVFVLLSLFEYILVLNLQSNTLDSLKNMCKKQKKKFPTFLGGEEKTMGDGERDWRENKSDNGRAPLLNGHHGNGETRLRQTTLTQKNEGVETTFIEHPCKNNNNTKEKTPRKPNPGSSHANCDVISRFLFPLGFIIFNLGYWTAYATQQKKFQHATD